MCVYAYCHPIDYLLVFIRRLLMVVDVDKLRGSSAQDISQLFILKRMRAE